MRFIFISSSAFPELKLTVRTGTSPVAACADKIFVGGFLLFEKGAGDLLHHLLRLRSTVRPWRQPGCRHGCHVLGGHVGGIAMRDITAAGVLGLRADDGHTNRLRHIFLAEKAAGIALELAVVVIRAGRAFQHRREAARCRRRPYPPSPDASLRGPFR